MSTLEPSQTSLPNGYVHSHDVSQACFDETLIRTNSTKIHPRHYQLRLFNLDFHNKQTFEGSVVIDIVIASTTQTVQLHAAGLAILSASLIQVLDDGELRLPHGKISTHTA